MSHLHGPELLLHRSRPARLYPITFTSHDSHDDLEFMRPIPMTTVPTSPFPRYNLPHRPADCSIPYFRFIPYINPFLSQTTPTTQALDTTSGPTTPIVSDTNTTAPNEAASKLVEAIDEFLGDIEKKFRGISEEILGKLDEMAERCDRLEQDMLMRETNRLVGDEGSGTGESTS